MRQATCLFVCLFLFQISVHAFPGIYGDWNRKWDIQLTQTHICAMTGSSVVLPCYFTYPRRVKVTKVYWAKNKQSAGISLRHSSKERVQYFWKNNNNCTMKLSNLTLLDKGEYRPVIESREKMMSHSKVTLSVKGLTVGITEPVIESKTVKLSCENICSSIGSFTVIWRKNSQDLSIEKTNNNELIFDSVSLDDVGNYSCALKDQEGQLSKPVELNVLYAPRNIVVTLGQFGEITEGSSVTLTCSSDANPPVENYTWYRRTGAETVHVGTGEIITFNLTSISAGLYHCEARNSVGALNSAGHEVVLVGFGGKRTTLWSPFIVVLFISLLIGLVFWRRKAKRHNIPRTTDTQQGILSHEYGDLTINHLTPGPAQNVDPDDVQYASLQFQTSRGQEVSLHSTIQRPEAHTQEQQEEEVEYAAVGFSRHSAATQ